MFNRIIQNCIDNIYDKDLEVQKGYLKIACNKVRSMDYKVCLDAKAFFVPNNDYLLKYTIPDVLSEQYGVYNYDGVCLWHSNVVFPIYDVGNTIVGLGGFNPVNYLKAHEEHDWSITYYQYSKKSVFPKGRYIYTLPGVYSKALEDGYLIVVDGLFDAIHLSSFGYNAAALMGSSITDEIIMQLRFIKKVIIISDNDAAGLRFIRTLKTHLHNTVVIYQGETKDVDELLKTVRNSEILDAINKAIKSDIYADIYLKIVT